MPKPVLHDNDTLGVSANDVCADLCANDVDVDLCPDEPGLGYLPSLRNLAGIESPAPKEDTDVSLPSGCHVTTQSSDESMNEEGVPNHAVLDSLSCLQVLDPKMVVDDGEASPNKLNFETSVDQNQFKIDSFTCGVKWCKGRPLIDAQNT